MSPRAARLGRGYLAAYDIDYGRRVDHADLAAAAAALGMRVEGPVGDEVLREMRRRDLDRARLALIALDIPYGSSVDPGDVRLAATRLGTVVEAERYRLYGRYADTRIRIVPAEDPAVLVTVLHVTAATVSPGQRVEAGQPIARHATKFPFASQIDRFAGRLPHVHLEVRRR